MTYLTILEKLKILLDILLDYKIILIFTILLIILTLLYLVKILNKKKYILSTILSFIVVFSISIISNYKILSTTFDNFTTIFFRGIYFPSIYLYITTLILLLVVFIMSILSIKLPKTYKVINTTAFIINNIFLAIILNIIAKNKIDIFSVNSLYTNTNLVVILELNMSMIIIWLLSLIVVYLTNIICDRITLKKKTKVPTTNEIVIDNIPLEESPNNKVVEEPVIASDAITITPSVNTKEKEDNTLIEETHTSKSTYTLEDYKKMIAMLKELKQFTNSSNISIDDAINISLISNYSIDDCLKFKEMLEGNLN